ncbi:MAG: hypothetical protein ACUVRQ_07350 [Thermoanaerobaculaceae bacterium]
MLAMLLLEQAPHFVEKVEVRQVVLHVRVLAPNGDPVLGLLQQNFRVLVDGQEVSLASAEWVDAQSPAPHTSPGLPGEQQKRLVVLLVQRNLQPARARGLIAFKDYLARLVLTLPPQDRVALLFHDSRLRLIQDFTSHRKRMVQLLTQQVFRAPPPGPADSDAPALAALLSEEQQSSASTIEQGLLVLAQALNRLSGERVLLLVGWGVGRLAYPSFFLPDDYFKALRLLQDNHVPVFSLDITQADWHTLEVGLTQVAESTGGFYAKTHLFPEQAFRRMLGSLRGYYELSFPRPPLPQGVHQVEVQLVGVDGLVLCRKNFADPPLESVR